MSDLDQLTKSRTQFDVSWRELMARNFVAGFSRSLGMILVQIVFFAIVLAVLGRYVVPVLTPVFNTMQNANDIFAQFKQSAAPNNLLPGFDNQTSTDLQNILGR